MAKKKRKKYIMTPQHKAKLRAAAAKRRGKPRGTKLKIMGVSGPIGDTITMKSLPVYDLGDKPLTQQRSFIERLEDAITRLERLNQIF